MRRGCRRYIDTDTFLLREWQIRRCIVVVEPAPIYNPHNIYDV